MAVRKDEKARMLFEWYQKGYSLNQLVERFGGSSSAIRSLFISHGLELRHKQPAPALEFNGEPYRLDSGYYQSANRRGPKSRLHQVVWTFHNGQIPPGHVIHHKDGNRANNDISNLECITRSEHSKRHAPLHKTIERHCVYCGKLLVRKVTVRPSRRFPTEVHTECPCVFNQRKYCDVQCKRNAQRGAEHESQ
jgi:hypothetical protein